VNSTVIQLPGPVAEFLTATHADGPKAYLRTYCPGSWCFLTAHDPDGQELSDEENEERNCWVVEHVTKLGFLTHTSTDAGAPRWLPSGGILVVGIPEIHAQQLGRELRQNAIVVGNGETCTLLYDSPQ